MKHVVMRIMSVFALSILALGGREAFAQEFKYAVEHDHLIKSCKGELVINRDGIEYRTDNKEHARKWAYTDIRMIKLVSPKKVEVISYESSRLKLGYDKAFEFKVLTGEVTKEVSDFLLARVGRPLATSFVASEEKPRYEIPVRHRHSFGGVQGRLKVYADRLVYESEKQAGSRSWRWSDVKGISRTGPYQFSITTFEPKLGGPTKTYNFDLKEPMSDGVYDQLWAQVYRPALPASPDDQREGRRLQP